MKICIIKLGALGDVVRTTSLIPALKQKYNADITWVTSEHAYPLLKYDSRIKAVPISQNTLTTADWVISLDDEMQSCALASSIETQKLSGCYWDNDAIRYTDDLQEWCGMGLLRPKEMGGKIEANRLKKANIRTYFEIMYDGLELDRPIFKPEIFGLLALPLPKGNNKTVGINAGAGPRWKWKSWGINQTLELSKRLARNGYDVLLLGGKAEEERNQCVVDAAKSPQIQMYYPENNDVLYLHQAIQQCDVIVSSDSLAMHLAVSSNIPVVAFFGPTSAAEIDLFGLGEKLETQLPCGRCYLSNCAVKPNCMQELSVDAVFDATLRWL
jgi:heptosyltransferase-2